jgi:hypothetical protein
VAFIFSAIRFSFFVAACGSIEVPKFFLLKLKPALVTRGGRQPTHTPAQASRLILSVSRCYPYKIRVDYALAVFEGDAVLSIAESDLQIVPILQHVFIAAPRGVSVIFNGLASRINHGIDFEQVIPGYKLKSKSAERLPIFGKDNTNGLILRLVGPNELMILGPRLDMADSVFRYTSKQFLQTTFGVGARCSRGHVGFERALKKAFRQQGCDGQKDPEPG